MQKKVWLCFCFGVICACAFAQSQTEGRLNKSLKALLDSVYEADQGIRMRINTEGEKYGLLSEERNNLFAQMAKNDSSNLVIVLKVLKEYGWVGTDVVGENANKAIWLVVQHADLKTRKKYLPHLKRSVAKGLSKPYYLALTEDRIAVQEGRKQIYGSQSTRDMTTGKYTIYPIQNEARVDERRKAMGMIPLAEEARSMGIDYVSPKK